MVPIALVALTALTALASPPPQVIEGELPRAEWVTQDGKHNLRFTFQSQLRYQLKGTGLDEAGQASVKLQRLWPGVSASLFNGRFVARLQLSATPGSPELLDAFVQSAVPLPALLGDAPLRVRAGLFIIPITWYRTVGWRQSEVSDWALVTKYLGAERQWGITVAREAGERAPLGFVLGLHTGENNRTAMATALGERVYGYELRKHSHLLDLQAPSRVHPEATGRLDLVLGQGPQRLTDTDGRPRGRLSLSAGVDLSPTRGYDHALRLAPEALFQGFGFSAHGLVFLTANHVVVDDNTPAAAGVLSLRATTAGTFTQLAWRWGFLELASELTVAYVTPAARRDARAWADEHSAGVPDARSAFKDVGQLVVDTEAAVGASLYLFRGVRLQGEFAALPQLRADVGVTHDWRARAQVTFVL